MNAVPSLGRKDAPAAFRSRRSRLIALGLTSLVIFAVAFVSFRWATARGPQPPTEIFQGVTYGCDELPQSEEGSGLLHWVKIDLSAPGIELYVTPLDPDAVAQGWEYRLQWIGSVVSKEGLAVAVNGMMFGSDSWWKLRLPGDLARGVETAVSDGVVSHVLPTAYLLWFDRNLVPHISERPPSSADLANAKWAVGTLAVWLRDGKVSPDSTRDVDARTAVAIDAERKLFFMAVGQSVSPRLILQKLADLGGRDGTIVDGGGSSSMAIGEGARGIRPGALFGGWRAVATYIGVKARPLQ